MILTPQVPPFAPRSGSVFGVLEGLGEGGMRGQNGKTRFKLSPSDLSETPAVGLDQRGPCDCILVWMKKYFALVAVSVAAVSLSGCYQTQEGRHRPGLPYLNDTIESRYERPMEQVYESAKATLAFNGVITMEGIPTHVLEAKVNDRTVWVRVDEVEPRVTRVFVQARRHGGKGDIHLAAELDKQIALRLR